MFARTKKFSQSHLTHRTRRSELVSPPRFSRLRFGAAVEVPQRIVPKTAITQVRAGQNRPVSLLPQLQLRQRMIVLVPTFSLKRRQPGQARIITCRAARNIGRMKINPVKTIQVVPAKLSNAACCGSPSATTRWTLSFDLIAVARALSFGTTPLPGSTSPPIAQITFGKLLYRSPRTSP